MRVSWRIPPPFQLLLKHGAQPSLGSNEIGLLNTCVHAAVACREMPTLQLLLRCGAPHSAVGKDGWTPLALAARSGNLSAVMLLLAAGADPDARMPSGKSARELAIVNNKAKVIEAFVKVNGPSGPLPGRMP